MTRKRSLALILLGAACAPLGAACGVSQGGLGGVATDDAGGNPTGSDSGLADDASPDLQDGSSSPQPQGNDSGQSDAPDDAAIQGDAGQDDAAQGDATLDGGGVQEGGADGGLDAGADATLIEAGHDSGPVGDAESGLDAAKDTGPDSGGVVDSGSRDGAGSDAAVDGGADSGPDSGPDAPTTCDFDGIWGSRLVIDVSWTPQGITGIILASGSGTITQWLMSTRTQSGSTVTESAVACGISLPDFEGTAIGGGEVYGIRFPNSLFDNGYVPPFAIQGSFSGTSPGSTYNTAAAAVLLGLTLTNPTPTSWPATITTEVDMDQDGKPGVTANTLNGNGYSYVPVDIFKMNRADEVYLAIRQVTQLSATATDCDHLTGTVSIPTISDSSNGTSKPAIDSHVIGCRISGTTTDCNSTQASFVDNTQPVFAPSGGSSFTSVRMPSGSTCATVRQTLL